MEDNIKAPATATKREAAPTPEPKVWKYVGPKEGPIISNLPGTGAKYHADELPQEYIQFVIDTVPSIRGWWV